MDTLEAILRGLLDLDDHAACTALADRLEESGHALAAAVRLLADATPVIPREWPRYYRWVDHPVEGGYEPCDDPEAACHWDHRALAVWEWGRSSSCPGA
jgi:hypothetical protein